MCGDKDEILPVNAAKSQKRHDWVGSTISMGIVQRPILEHVLDSEKKK